MKKFICCALLLASTTYAQAQDSVFDVARLGTKLEMSNTISHDKSLVNAVNSDSFTPLILACYRSNNEVAEFLIQNGANLNAISNMGTALMASSFKGNIFAANLLLVNGANPDLADANGNTALMYAVKMQNVPLVELLLKYKANKELLDAEGKTAFEYAAFSGNQTIVELLKRKL